MISGAHRWEKKYTYLHDIYCIVKPWIQRNKSISQIKMCMCGEWMAYGNDGDNSGESLILLLLFGGDTYLSCFLKLCEENEMIYIFFFFPLRWVFCALLGILNIITKSRLSFLILITVPKMPNLSLIPLKWSCHPEHGMRDAVLKYAIALLNK